MIPAGLILFFLSAAIVACTWAVSARSPLEQRRACHMVFGLCGLVLAAAAVSSLLEGKV